MIRNLSLGLFAAVVFAAFTPSEAQAQWGLPGYGLGYLGGGYGQSVYSVYDQDRLPYFALHPPVYYSRAVPRTFGYSPFAYPGWVPTPALPTVGPEMIVNPYIDQLPESRGDGDAPTLAPPAANPPAPKAGPLQGFKPPRSNSRGLNGSIPKIDRSAAVDSTPAPVPMRIFNPHVEPRILTTSVRKAGE